MTGPRLTDTGPLSKKYRPRPRGNGSSTRTSAKTHLTPGCCGTQVRPI